MAVEKIVREPGQRPSPNAKGDEVLGQSTLDPDAPKYDTVVKDLIIHPESDGGEEVRLQVQTEQVLREAEEALAQPPRQRHGCVEQRRGISLRDESGNVIGATEEWRCQCKEKFKGRTPAETERLYMRHIRAEDPQVPREPKR